MVEAGHITIGGSIDTAMIERGFVKIKKGFDRVKSSTKSFAADMVRIGQATAKAAKSLGVIATVGLGAIIGLAKNAPAVAPAMARIGIEFQRLSRILGEQLRPMFEKFSTGFVKFVNFVEAHPNITKAFVISAGAITGILAMTKLITALTGVVSPAMLAALGIAGAIGGTAAVIKNVAADPIREKTSNFIRSERESRPGDLHALRSVDQSASEAAAYLRANPINGSIHAAEVNRKAFLLRWWDSLWS